MQQASDMLARCDYTWADMNNYPMSIHTHSHHKKTVIATLMHFFKQTCMLTHPGAFAPCMLAASVFDMMRNRERSGVRERRLQLNLSGGTCRLDFETK